MQPLANSIVILILSAALTFLATLYWVQRGEARKNAEEIQAEHQKVLDRVTVLESQLALVKQEVVPISTAFQAILIKELTHYHTPEMDDLLVKVGPPNVLSEEEEIRLILMLKERTKDMGPMISPSERDAAMILPAVMSRAKVEQEIIKSAEDLKLKLVSVAAVVGIPNAPSIAVPASTEGTSPDEQEKA